MLSIVYIKPNKAYKVQFASTFYNLSTFQDISISAFVYVTENGLKTKITS